MSYPFVGGLSQVTWSMAWKFCLIFDTEKKIHTFLHKFSIQQNDSLICEKKRLFYKLQAICVNFKKMLLYQKACLILEFSNQTQLE